MFSVPRPAIGGRNRCGSSHKDGGHERCQERTGPERTAAPAGGSKGYFRRENKAGRGPREIKARGFATGAQGAAEFSDDEWHALGHQRTDKGHVATAPVALGHDRRPLEVTPRSQGPCQRAPPIRGRRPVPCSYDTPSIICAPLQGSDGGLHELAARKCPTRSVRKCPAWAYIVLHPHTEPAPMAVINDGYIPPSPCPGPSYPVDQHRLELCARQSGDLFEHDDDH
jgi:hypothetical protein